MAEDSVTVSHPDSYIIDLQVWGIANDFTNPLATSNGINNAMQWAVNNGYTQVTLPKGNYLIEHNTPIIPQSYVTLNLNGSTLKMEGNNTQANRIIYLNNNQQSVIIKNGKIQGDRYTHDYSPAGTHENGEGLHVFGGAKFIYFENLELCECIGDGIGIGPSWNSVGSLINSDVELGNIDKTTGLLVTSTSTIRSVKSLKFTHSYFKTINHFQLTGNSYGTLYGVITKFFCAYFYDATNTYLSCVDKVRFFEDINIPTGADHVLFVFYQNTIPSEFSVGYRCPECPDHIYVTNCNIHHNRRCGAAIGGRNLYFVGNKIHDMQGTLPQAGIDVEEGGAGNQNIYIENNHFYNNTSYNICLLRTRHAKVMGNRFGSTGLVGVVTDGSTEDIIISNNLFDRAAISLGGSVIFSNNFILHSYCYIPLIDVNIHIADCIFTNSLLSLNNTRAYGVTVDNCKFYNDADKITLGTHLNTLALGRKPAIIRNCVFDGLDVNYIYATSANIEDGWIIDNTVFTNIKTPISLPHGKYTNCKFLTNSYINFVGTGNYVFKSCYFHQSSSGLYIDGGIANMKISNCFFDVIGPVGYGNATLRIKNVGRMIFDGNTIDAQTLTATNFSLIEVQATFTGTLLLITNNNILTNKACKAIDTSVAIATTPIVVKNNNLFGGCTLNLRSGDINLRND